MFEIKDFLHIIGLQIVDLTIIYDGFSVRKSGGAAFKNCLIIDDGLYVFSGKVQIEKNIRLKFIFGISKRCKFLFNPSNLFP